MLLDALQPFLQTRGIFCPDVKIFMYFCINIILGQFGNPLCDFQKSSASETTDGSCGHNKLEELIPVCA